MFVGSLEPVSNKATWTAFYELRDAQTDEPLDLSSLDEIEVQVRSKERSHVLATSLTEGGVSIVDTGVFSWTFSASDMEKLAAPRTYEVGCVMEGNGEKMQLIIGLLPVLDGVVQ